MASHTCKPGFLLIEIMVAFLLLIISGSIAGIWIGYSNQQQGKRRQQLKNLSIAIQVLDKMKEGLDDVKEGHIAIVTSQRPILLEWDDGKTEQVWLAQVTAGSQKDAQIALDTVVREKAL